MAILLRGAAGSGKKFLGRCLSRRSHMNFLLNDCYELWSEVPGSSEAKMRNLFKKGTVMQMLKLLETLNGCKMSAPDVVSIIVTIPYLFPLIKRHQD